MTTNERYPEPRTVRDLWLMGKTSATGWPDGIVECMGNPDLPRYSSEYEEGMVVRHAMTVQPDVYTDSVRVRVERVVVSNLRDGVYTPDARVLWERVYQGFDAFRGSPFWDLTLRAWANPNARWDTSPLDDHDVDDEGDRWWMHCHYLKHRTDWYGNDRLSGEIGDLYLWADDDGYMTILMDGEEVFDGLTQDLARVLREHREMADNLDRMKEHGVDVKNGTLSVRLWGEDGE